MDNILWLKLFKSTASHSLLCIWAHHLFCRSMSVVLYVSNRPNLSHLLIRSISKGYHPNLVYNYTITEASCHLLVSWQNTRCSITFNATFDTVSQLSPRCTNLTGQCPLSRVRASQETMLHPSHKCPIRRYHISWEL